MARGSEQVLRGHEEADARLWTEARELADETGETLIRGRALGGDMKCNCDLAHFWFAPRNTERATELFGAECDDALEVFGDVRCRAKLAHQRRAAEVGGERSRWRRVDERSDEVRSDVDTCSQFGGKKERRKKSARDGWKRCGLATEQNQSGMMDG